MDRIHPTQQDEALRRARSGGCPAPRPTTEQPPLPPLLAEPATVARCQADYRAAHRCTYGRS